MQTVKNSCDGDAAKLGESGLEDTDLPRSDSKEYNGADQTIIMEDRIDPWGSQSIDDYGKLRREFGIKGFRPLLSKIPEPHMLMTRGVVFGHRDFERIARSMKERKEFVMLTGLMPSGKFHIGHRMVAEQIIYYQMHGARTMICVADIEAYNMRKASMKELRKTAIEEYLINYIALGLKPRNCDFYFQSNRSRNGEKAGAYYRLAGMVARKTTMNEMGAIYGEMTPGKIMSVMTQVSDILHPQLPEFGGPKPVVVPVGVDQDPHLRLTRDLAARFQSEFDFILPSSTYHEFMPGLKGGKMSSSDPYSYIALTDDPKTVKYKIMKHAFSGGRGSVEEHRKLGGNPEVDVAYRMLYMMFEPDDRKIKKIHDDYRSGKMLTGELKQITIEKVNSFLEKHREKREKARGQVHRFLEQY
jgi:tryptophanyl-tRNA synthetase